MTRVLVRDSTPSSTTPIPPSKRALSCYQWHAEKPARSENSLSYLLNLTAPIFPYQTPSAPLTRRVSSICTPMAKLTLFSTHFLSLL